MPLEERIALLMQANFDEIGFKAEVKKVPWALFTEQVTKPENTPNISQIFVDAVTGDPDTLLYNMYILDRRHLEVAGISKDAKVDELLNKGRTVTRRERAAVYKKSASGCASWRRPSSPTTRRRVHGKQARVRAGAVGPAKAFGLSGMGFTFRLMEMTE